MNNCLDLGRDSAHKNERQLYYKKDDTSISIIFDNISDSHHLLILLDAHLFSVDIYWCLDVHVKIHGPPNIS